MATFDKGHEPLIGPGTFRCGVASIMLGTDDRVSCAVDASSDRVYVRTVVGVAQIVMGDVTMTVPVGSAVGGMADLGTGRATITSIVGTVTITLGDASASLPPGAVVTTDLAPGTGGATITVVSGPPISVTSAFTTIMVPASGRAVVFPGDPPILRMPSPAGMPLPPPVERPVSPTR